MSGLSDVNEPVPHRCVRRVSDGHWATYADVQQTGTTSCRLCGLSMRVLEAFARGEFPALFQGVDEARSSAILQELRFRPNWDVPEWRSTMALSFRGSVLELSITRDSDARAFAVEGVTFPCPNRMEQCLYGETGCLIAPVPRPSDRHYSEGSLERATTWLRDCLEHHDCGKSDFYPKRLLDLRGDQIRLFETNEVKSFKGPYVCLSHRWGSSGKRLISTVVNIDNHMNGIPEKEVPRTFQDAIAVCKRMSVGYLWIDTVCILQKYGNMSVEDMTKTEADFAAENSAMARIYQNSQFTICASMSTSMDSGMFSTKYDHRIEVIADDGIEASLRIRVVHSHKTPPTDLETRGWTYQEYLLPPRVLEFGPFDISWRCKRGQFCECAAKTFTTDWGWRGELASRTQPHGYIKGEVERWWTRIVRRYSARNLTNHEDKLPALSGLAQIYHEITHDTYLAGLWKASLPQNLCWYHCSGEFYESTATVGIGRRQRMRAPSWSWASLDALHNAQCRTWWPGTVDYFTSPINDYPDEAADLRVVCKVYEATVQPQTGDPFGKICPDGVLKLGVTLISAKIDTKAQGDESHSDMDCFKGSVPWTLDKFNEDDTHFRFCFPDCELEDDYSKIGNEVDKNHLKIGDEVHCAPILERLSEKRSERGCLVLKRRQDQDYQRVGFCILLKENPSYFPWPRKDKWEPNSPETRNYALQLDTETRIKIV